MKDEREVLAAQMARYEGPRPGDVYVHYKGGLYEIIARSIHEETFEQLVTYRSHEKNYVWTRTLANFTELVSGNQDPPEHRFKPLKIVVQDVDKLAEKYRKLMEEADNLAHHPEDYEADD